MATGSHTSLKPATVSQNDMPILGESIHFCSRIYRCFPQHKGIPGNCYLATVSGLQYIQHYMYVFFIFYLQIGHMLLKYGLMATKTCTGVL
jgi:hypothetical protein